MSSNSVTPDTERKLIVHKTFRRRSRGLLNVLCTFNLRPVSRRYDCVENSLYLFGREFSNNYGCTE